MANIIGVQTLNKVNILLIDTDPSLGGGVAAPIGSFGSAEDGSGLFFKQGALDTEWYKLVQSNSSAINNILVVVKNPVQGQYATIEDALAAITTNSPTNPFVISVGAGVFTENQLNCKPYVSIIGSGIQVTIIEPAGNHDLFVITDVFTELSFMSLRNVPSGYSAIFCNDSGDYFQAHKVNFVDCDTNVKIVSNTQDTIAYLEYVDCNGVMTYGNHITSNGGFRAVINTESYFTFPSASGFTACYLTGTKAFTQINSCGLFGTPSQILPPVAGNYGIVFQNGAEVSMSSGVLGGFETAIENLNVGAGCLIDCVGTMIDDCINDIIISNPLTSGGFTGAAAVSKITVNPACDFAASFTQPEVAGGGYVITGNIINGDKISEVVEITTLINNQTLGLLSGDLSDGGGFQVDISAGEGYLIDGTILKKITWASTNITLGVNQTKYIYFDSNGLLSTSNSTPSTLSNILLGRVNTDGTHIQFIDKINNTGVHTTNRINELIKEVFGSLYYFGSIFSENITPLKLDVTNGEYYFGANEFAPSGGTAIVFDKYYQDGLGGWTIVGAVDTVPNDKYDNGSGVLQNMTAGYYAKGLMYVVGDGGNQKYFFVYPQSEYSTLLAAQVAALPIPPVYFNDGVVKVASFIVQQGNPNIVEIISERPLPTTQTSASAPISSHLALTNLTSGNAGHTQFMMLDGSTPMIGDLNMNTHDINNAGTYNGVVIEAHAARHLPNGADPLTTAAPTSNLGGASTNSVGIQNSLSRSDHSHAIDQADALTTGLLKATDWTTFNNKQNALGYTPVNKAGDSGVGLITFLNNQGIDVDLSGGSDVLNIGTSNADIINIGYAGSVVNIIGTLSYQNVDTLQVKDKLFTVNKGGGVASGSSAGFEIEEGGVITGWFATNGTRDGWDFKAPAIAGVATLSLAALTASRVWAFPDFADTFVGLTGTQILTNKSIGDKIINLNANGGVSSGTNVGWGVIENGVQTGFFVTNAGRDGFAILNPAQAFTIGLSFSSLTVGRTFSFPNANGTIALINGGQTFTSAIWNGTVIGVAYGGTGTGTTFTAGSVVFAGALGVYSQDNTNYFWDNTNKRLGIGTATPTASLDLAASLAAASSLIVRAGVAPTVPNVGDVWNDSTQLAFKINQAIGSIAYSGFLSGNTANSNTVVSTVVETNFTSNGSTFVIPANSLAVGKRIRITAWGIYSAVLGNTLTLRLKTGATTLLTTRQRAQQTVSVTNVGFKIDAIIAVRTTGAGGTVACEMSTLFQETPFADGSVVPSNGTKAFNTTVANTIQFSAQWGTSSASNSITIENIIYEVLN